MKKMLRTLSLALVVCLLLTGFAGAKTVMTTYEVKELDLTIGLPDTLVVLKDEIEDQVCLEFVNADYEKKGCTFVGTVSVQQEPDLEDYAFQYSQHYDHWDGAYLDEAAWLFGKLWDVLAGSKVDVSADTYENDQTVYLETVTKTRVNGKSCRTATYTTTYDGVTYVIAFATVGNAQTRTIETIMDSVRLGVSEWSESGFHDLAGHWAEAEVTKAVELGLFSGITKTAFHPDAPMTRAMLVQVLYRMEKEPKVKEIADFSDVEDDAWYADAVSWAAGKEIVNGANGKFDPDGVLTREQLCAILWRYAKSEKRDVSVGENTNILSYNDAFDIAEYAIPAMQWACGAGLISGENGWLMPQAAATRAQVAAMLVRYLGK